MSLAVFESFLTFAEQAVAAKKDLPPSIDPAEMESALVSHGVVLLYSHMEECLRSALDARCSRCVDAEVRAFALSVKDKETGRIGIDALKSTLARFNAGYKKSFKDSLDASGLESSWGSIMTQRSVVAHHGKPATCSLADLRLYYDGIRRVLGFFCHGLGLDAVEVATISSLIIMPPSPIAAIVP